MTPGAGGRSLWRWGRPGGARRVRVWRLRTHLSALLLANMLVTFTVVGTAVTLWRVPEIERRSAQALDAEMADVTALLELALGARLDRLRLVADLVREQPAARATALLEGVVDNGSLLQVVLVLSPQGRVEAAGLPLAQRARTADLVGSDYSGNALYRAAVDGRTGLWSGRFVSAASGQASVGLALREASGRVLIGEVPLPRLLGVLQVAAGRHASSIWLMDRAGEVVADTEGGTRVGTLNLLGWPVMHAMLHQGVAPSHVMFEGRRFRTIATHAQALDWFLIGRAPAGWSHPDAQRLIWYVAGSYLGCLAIGLLIAPFWAQRMARPLQHIVARAALTTAGHDDGAPWPRGSVAEFNGLVGHLEAMAVALQEREQKFQAIFNASPVPMGVADVGEGGRLLDVNDAWCRVLQRRREDVLGKTTVEIALWTAEQRDAMLARVRGGQLSGETVVLRGDGQPKPVQMYGRGFATSTQELMVWATVDIGPMRRIENGLRDLNQQLEARVQERTQALVVANAELSRTVEQLREAQDELVRAGKMAALGSLVAGVAHELNTPLSNGVMAVSAMADDLRTFQVAMQGPLRRADLQQLVDGMQQGTDIAQRNLRRAAELVQSFKQVAVDQTSSQRRSFELAEVVHEMVVSLRPSFARTPYRIDVDVPETGMQLDSYPGALGQVLGNLIQNALLHGFEGRPQGRVRIEAERAQDGSYLLRVADDGKGIAATHLGRIFEPFMTTKMGRGGTGLGLHVSYNAVVNLLGGSLAVHSTEGEGSCFTLRLPACAPRLTDASAMAA